MFPVLKRDDSDGGSPKLEIWFVEDHPNIARRIGMILKLAGSW